MNKKIFLAGDICEDWLLFDNNMLPNGINENLRPEYGRGTIFHSLPGGVLLLNQYLSALLPNAEILNKIEIEKAKRREAIRSIARLANRNTKNKDWAHVIHFLQYSVVNEDNVINSLPQNKNLADADLIILDDTGFSIRHANCEWINSLQENKNDFCIIHKLFWSLNNNKLLEKLTENFSEKIVAVIDADDLREHGCNISRQLSWDKTIEDFLTVFVSNPAFEH